MAGKHMVLKYRTVGPSKETGASGGSVGRLLAWNWHSGIESESHFGKSLISLRRFKRCCLVLCRVLFGVVIQKLCPIDNAPVILSIRSRDSSRLDGWTFVIVMLVKDSKNTAVAACQIKGDAEAAVPHAPSQVAGGGRNARGVCTGAVAAPFSFR